MVNGIEYGRLIVGDNVHIGPHFRADCHMDVIIEDNCLFADNVSILTSNHGMNPEEADSYANTISEIAGVKVEEGCWLGARVSVLAGVTIGKRTIIGTNAVVTKDIPPYSIAVGIPAKVIKKWSFEQHKWVDV